MAPMTVSSLPASPADLPGKQLGSIGQQQPDDLGRAGVSPAHRKASLLFRWVMAGVGCAALPCQLCSFLSALFSKFGFYVPTAALGYGLNQSYGLGTGTMARRVYFAKVLKLDGATSGRYAAAAGIPWAIKPLCGMLTDSVPLFGYHRTSYLVLAGLCGIVAWTSLGALPVSGRAAVPLFMLVNLSSVFSDVLIDGRTAELSKMVPESAASLQSLLGGSAAIGALLTCSTSGVLVDHLGPRVVFMLCNICTLGVLVPGLLGWLGDRRLPANERKVNLTWFREHTTITFLAFFITGLALPTAILQFNVEGMMIRGIVTILGSAALIGSLFITLRRLNPLLAKAAMYIYLHRALQPGVGEAMFQWLMLSPGGPRFSPTILSLISCTGALSLLASVVVYSKYLSEVNLRRIFFCGQLATVISSSFDVVLVRRWNLAIGIPDMAMLLSDDAFSIAVGQFLWMPLCVLSAKVCPDNAEATLFAILMALNNFGMNIADLLGVFLLEAFGVVDGNFERLDTVLIVKTCFRFLPMVFIPWLVPNLRSTDPIPLHKDGPRTSSTGVSAEHASDTESTMGENQAVEEVATKAT